jgi:hypothetical protein
MNRHSLAFVFPLLAIACATGATTDVGGDPGTDGGGGTMGSMGTGSGEGGGGTMGGGSDSGGGGGTKDSGGGTGTDSGGGGGMDSGGGGNCTGYADPNTTADCVDTQYCGGSKPPCNPNGCDTTYWCDLSTKKCVKKPAGC